MSCNNACKLCQRLVISQSVTYTAPNLIVNIPSGSYADNERYCVIIAQNIPSTATINAPVVITIGSGTVQYPVVKSDCSPLTASGIGSRTKYPMRVETTPSSGLFRLLGKTCCVNRNLTVITGTASVPSASNTASTNGEG